MGLKLLIKFPTRGRCDKFFNVLDMYYANLDDIDNTRFVVTCDLDDESMCNDTVKEKFKTYSNLEVYYGESKTKIEAVNKDIYDKDFDVILLASDDVIPQIKGYDTIIKSDMSKHFPNTDGVLWYFDGYRKDLNTLCILGKKYYERFDYIYHPDYKSFYSDNEFTQVANLLGKQKYIDICIIKHVHPDITKEFFTEYDETYLKNNFSGDEIIFRDRVNNNFNIQLQHD